MLEACAAQLPLSPSLPQLLELLGQPADREAVQAARALVDRAAGKRNLHQNINLVLGAAWCLSSDS